MLDVIIVILLILWFFGGLTHVAGDFIHLLLLLAIGVLLIRVARGQSV